MANTITIETDLKSKIKILAAKENKSMKEIIVEALNDILIKYANK